MWSLLKKNKFSKNCLNRIFTNERIKREDNTIVILVWYVILSFISIKDLAKHYEKHKHTL